MKVKELIEELLTYDGETEIGVPYITYGTPGVDEVVKCCEPSLSIGIDSYGTEYGRIKSI